MGTIKKAQFGERVGRSGGRSCGIEKQIRKDERQAARENRQADRQARREERRAPKMRYGGKAKKGGSFPDLTGDGKVTRADILKGRGVIKNGGKLKKQAAVAIAMKAAGKKPKKAQTGVKLNTSQYKRLGRLRAKNPAKAERVGGRMVERATRLQRGKDYIKSHQYELMPSAKKGTKLKMGGKCRGGCY